MYLLSNTVQERLDQSLNPTKFWQQSQCNNFSLYSKPGSKNCLLNVQAYKIDDSTFETFEKVIASFQVKNKLG